ncbi:MAG: TerB family tellurite resistance protein [Rhodospirillales bacterium]|nr:TerB family tellurite resistance protein [Rhodospirillales bacterium]
MFSRIKELLQSPGTPERAMRARGAVDELQLAAAALLVEAALMDECFEAAERAKIVELLTARFGLEAAETETLLETARAQVAQSSQLFGFTRVVNDRFSHDERIELMEMLWQVAYADGRLDDYEANLMRRLAGLIHVSDRESGRARKEALARLGLEP